MKLLMALIGLLSVSSTASADGSQQQPAPTPPDMMCSIADSKSEKVLKRFTAEYGMETPQVLDDGNESDVANGDGEFEFSILRPATQAEKDQSLKEIAEKKKHSLLGIGYLPLTWVTLGTAAVDYKGSIDSISLTAGSYTVTCTPLRIK